MNTEPEAEDAEEFSDEWEVPLLGREPYNCAFCGVENDVLVDGSAARVQRFTEDCEVCCRPNLLSITIQHDNSVEVVAEQEYEA